MGTPTSAARSGTPGVKQPARPSSSMFVSVPWCKMVYMPFHGWLMVADTQRAQEDKNMRLGHHPGRRGKSAQGRVADCCERKSATPRGGGRRDLLSQEGEVQTRWQRACRAWQHQTVRKHQVLRMRMRSLLLLQVGSIHERRPPCCLSSQELLQLRHLRGGCCLLLQLGNLGQVRQLQLLLQRRCLGSRRSGRGGLLLQAVRAWGLLGRGVHVADVCAQQRSAWQPKRRHFRRS